MAGLRARGLSALRCGDAALALETLTQAVRLNPGDAELQQGRGAAALALGRLDAAKEAYAGAVALDPSRVDALRGLGHSARRSGDRTEALRWFEAACAQDPKLAKHHHEVGEALRSLGRLGEAAEAFDRALALEPQHRPSLLSGAAMARARGDHAAALDRLKVAAAFEPNDAAIQLDIADLLCAIGSLDEAETAYRALLATEGLRFQALRGLATIASRRDDAAVALDLLRQAAQLCDDARLAVDIAKQRTALGEDPGDVYRPLLSDDRTRQLASAAFTAHARRQRDTARAQSWLDMIVAADPTCRPAAIALAELHHARWDLDQAEAILHSLAAVTADAPDVLTAQGRLARTRGLRVAARQFFEHAYRLDPVAGATELAHAFRDEGAFVQARTILEKARAERPDDISVVVQLGVTARAAGDIEGALAHFDQAIERAPDHASAMVEKAATLQRAGRFAEMHALLGRAVASAPNHPRVLNALADLALAADDPEGALIHLRHAVAVGSATAGMQLKIARSEAALGQVAEALATIERVIATKGRSPDALLLKAQIHRQQGLIDETAEIFDAAVSHFPDSFQLWFQRALFLADTGRQADMPIDLGGAPASTVAERTRAASIAGLLAAGRWNFARARAHYRTAVEGNPMDHAGRTRLATAALLDLDVDEAEAQLRTLARTEASARRLRGQSLGPYQTLPGQILDEARIDKNALDRLVEAGRAPAAHRLEALRAVVSAYPDMTLAAMQLLLTLRRQGRFDATPPKPEDGQAIPDVIVQFWHADTPPADVLRLTQSWVDLNPLTPYRRLTDRTARAFLEAEYPPVVTDAYRRAREPARRADILRLAYLLRFGGFYADADDRCAAPIGTLLSAGGQLVLYQEDIGSVGNNIMAAAPNHPLLRRALNLAVASATAGDNDIPWLATGPGLLTRVLAQMVAESGPMCIQTTGLRLLTRRALLPYVATGCVTAYKNTRRHWSRAAFLTPPALSVASHDARDPIRNTVRKREAS